ncbi:UNVERIFIED_CONTAM: hypothetical protein Sradi_3757800 [Sesamum radiatum]|uniref:Uncharacterized protein n=1 Tax=Sesamum radiatum TaxID=300843 RepID=A0AAW2PZ21_SESRA
MVPMGTLSLNTLPTQFYTALIKEETEPLQPKLHNGGTTSTNAPVEVPRRRDFYFMAIGIYRGSIVRTCTRLHVLLGEPLDGEESMVSKIFGWKRHSPTQCYIKARSGPPALDHHSSSSDDDDYDDNNNESVFRPPSSKSATQPRQIPRQVKYGTFAAATAHLPRLSEALRRALVAQPLLQEHEFSENPYGEWLGWLMAAIYMGGRIPQIWLNGLNPLMFVFALVANATYTGSILVRTTEWRMIKANMPWLLDAIACVGLDLFVSFLVYNH